MSLDFNPLMNLVCILKEGMKILFKRAYIESMDTILFRFHFLWILVAFDRVFEVIFTLHR